MDYVDGRGISCGNDVYFNYIDGRVVMSMYRDVPGVAMARRDPNVVKSFTPAQWGEVNDYLLGVSHDEESPEETLEEEEVTVPGPNIVSAPSLKTGQGVLPQVSGIPKMGNAEDILPENSVPAMTKDKIQEKFDPITGTQNEGEEGKDGEE